MCDISMHFSGSNFEGVWTAMQKPVSELTDLWLRASNAAAVVPDSILDSWADLPRVCSSFGWTADGIYISGIFETTFVHHVP